MLKEEDGSSKKISSTFFITLILLGASFLAYFLAVNNNFSLNEEVDKSLSCGDATPYGACSLTKPYFCEGGILIEKSSACGCSDISTKDGESCTFQYKNYSQKNSLKYIFNGKTQNIDLTVYAEMADYLYRVPRVIDYGAGEKPVRTDFKLKMINDENQKELLMPLVVQIQNLANNSVDQARIAVSIVQNIPYNYTEKKVAFAGGQIDYSLYPYEVLYFNQGICGEKSALLAFLLKEIGYNVSIFYFAEENHEVVGIKCPVEKSFRKTGYCFVETGGPAIITDSSLEYVNGIKIKSEPEIMPLSGGMSLPGDMQEYKDAKTMKNIRAGNILGFFESGKFDEIKERYGLIEEYNLL
ncbi:MAG: hypothetical protein AABX76_02400 [Nanoarchaeota archaeon]